jgi:two-component system chemotaxis response regulator CheY
MSYTALIIDDSPLMRKMVERSLRATGLDLGEVFQAGDGQQGLDALNDRHVDLVLCDMNMPNMDGLEFVKSTGDMPNRPVIVMVTTEGADSPGVNSALAAGAQGHLKKPFKVDEFDAKVRPLLNAA